MTFSEAILGIVDSETIGEMRDHVEVMSVANESNRLNLHPSEWNEITLATKNKKTEIENRIYH